MTAARIVSLHQRGPIAAFLRRDLWLHLYSLGDLDPLFWPHTQWYGWVEGSKLQAAALLYLGGSLPVLLALDSDPARLGRLLQGVLDWLPRRLYAHLSPGQEQVLESVYALRSHGAHYKMALTAPGTGAAVDCSEVAALTTADLPAILDLLAVGYAEHAFEARVLATGQTCGVWRDGRLVALGSVHVYAPRYSVAALGNIMTHPAYRGQGLATAVTAALCRRLQTHITHIGLNVKCDNQAALRVYARLGFTTKATYGEFSAEARPPQPVGNAKNG